MRIVQVVHGLPPAYLGGTEIYAATLAQELARQGHTVSVFTRGEAARQPEYALETTLDGQVEITRINHTRRDCLGRIKNRGSAVRRTLRNASRPVREQRAWVGQWSKREGLAGRAMEKPGENCSAARRTVRIRIS